MTVSPDGNRYQINSRNNHVTYMGWDFFLSWRRETGLAFWNVNFRDSKVLYEMSLQEASASYSMASDPAGMTSQLLDRYWGLGAASTELIEGYDCPHGSTFLNSNFYLGERSYRAVNNICIFEMDLGRPMSRHNDRATIRSTKGVAMVVRWTATVGTCCGQNYETFFATDAAQFQGTMIINSTPSSIRAAALSSKSEPVASFSLDTGMSRLVVHTVGLSMAKPR